MRAVLVASLVLAVERGGRARTAGRIKPRPVQPMQPGSVAAFGSGRPRNRSDAGRERAVLGVGEPDPACSGFRTAPGKRVLHAEDRQSAGSRPAGRDTRHAGLHSVQLRRLSCAERRRRHGAGVERGPVHLRLEPREFVPQHLPGAPERHAHLGRHSARIDDLGACRLRPEHRPSAERTRSANDLENAAIAGRRADARRVPADGESLELHDDLQQRPAAGRRVTAMRRRKAHDLSTVVCASVARPCPAAAASMEYLHADGLGGRRILPLTAGIC